MKRVSRRVAIQWLNWLETIAFAVLVWAVNDPALRETVFQLIKDHVDVALVPLLTSAASAVLAYLSRKYPSQRSE